MGGGEREKGGERMNKKSVCVREKRERAREQGGKLVQFESSNHLYRCLLSEYLFFYFCQGPPTLSGFYYAYSFDKSYDL